MGSYGKFRKNPSGTIESSENEFEAAYIQLKQEQDGSIAAPPDGEGGYLYAKEDGKVYWKSNELTETDLTVGATSVAGADTQLQYNNGGSAGGTAAINYNDGTGYLGMATTGGDITHRITLPNVDGAAGSIKANAYVTYSSKRYKASVKKIENPVELINQIDGVMEIRCGEPPD